ncbi:hypothetical protein [Pseudoalteromonas sp. SR41-6]|uniref:hypothetical protein n=1 Tax=Pseudoalteromonas sp. SR41-6 TaxID=2760948 RepID=UPI001601B33B|nr:hypothetical protein [Pseudoalteromonas sp. SR41-6]MBB1333920.1 hypothetical protein [Pseudoalteromonas sp. SR41-6]
MTKTEYKESRKKAGLSVTDWIKALDISLATHKSYCCGRRSVSLKRAKYINQILLLQQSKKE